MSDKEIKRSEDKPLTESEKATLVYYNNLAKAVEKYIRACLIAHAIQPPEQMNEKYLKHLAKKLAKKHTKLVVMLVTNQPKRDLLNNTVIRKQCFVDIVPIDTDAAKLKEAIKTIPDTKIDDDANWEFNDFGNFADPKVRDA